MKIYLNTEKKMELKLFNNKIKRDARGFFINVGDYIDELIRTQHFDAMRNVETKLYEEIEVYKDAIDYNVIAIENLYVPVDRMENWNFDRIYLNKLVRLKVNNRRRNADYRKVYVSGYYGASKNDFYEIQMPTRCG